MQNSSLSEAKKGIPYIIENMDVPLHELVKLKEIGFDKGRKIFVIQAIRNGPVCAKGKDGSFILSASIAKKIKVVEATQ